MKPRIRVITDNDYSGDPDGLFQLAHLLLSPSVEVPLIIGSHIGVGDPFDPSDRQADNAAARAGELTEIVRPRRDARIVAGSNSAMEDRHTSIASAAARSIIDEAMRPSDLPLFITLGGGLTELASALLIEPRIADRFTAIWIGGGEYPGSAAPPPHSAPVEYNLAIDIAAAQVVFDSSVELWQVPRNAYRQALMSEAEISSRVAPQAEVGSFLADAMTHVRELAESHGILLGEAYVMGDSPLVLLTALLSSVQPDASSSKSSVLPRPSIADDGSYAPHIDARPLRVFEELDTRLMFEDFFLKLEHRATERD